MSISEQTALKLLLECFDVSERLETISSIILYSNSKIETKELQLLIKEDIELTEKLQNLKTNIYQYKKQ